jgi:hypothetical protein
MLSVTLPGFFLPLPSPSATNGPLFLNSSHLAGRNVPSFSPGFAQDSLLHDLFAKALEQALLRFAIPQRNRCQPTHPLPPDKSGPQAVCAGNRKPGVRLVYWMATGFARRWLSCSAVCLSQGLVFRPRPHPWRYSTGTGKSTSHPLSLATISQPVLDDHPSAVEPIITDLCGTVKDGEPWRQRV